MSGRRIAAHYTLCPHLGLIPRAILNFDSEGRLTSVESDVACIDSMYGVEFYSGIIIPGIVLCSDILADIFNNNSPQSAIMRQNGVMAVGTGGIGEFPFIDKLKKNGIASLTIEPARKLGLEYVYGSFEVGKRPGVVLLDSPTMEGVESSKRLL